MSVEINEVAVFAIAMLTMLFALWEVLRTKCKPVHVGLLFLFAGTVFTIVENFYFPEIFNFLEHFVGVTLAGLTFAYLSKQQLRKVKEMSK